MKVSDDVLEELSQVVMHPTRSDCVVIARKLDRKMYLRVDEVLQAAGGKWSRSAKAHVFDVDPSAVIDRVILTGEIAHARKDLEFFESPPPVVAAIMERAQIGKGDEVLEPSAGRGAIAVAARAAGGRVSCVECHPPHVEHLTGELGFARSLVTLGDFMTVAPPHRLFDRVVMNPPFSGGQDIAHVMRALAMLRPGGVLVSVMSAGVVFRQDRRTRGFRDLVNEKRADLEELPEGSFKSSGTSVRTVLATFRLG